MVINLLCSYRIESFMIVEDNSKDKCYSLVSVSGDAFVARGTKNTARKHSFIPTTTIPTHPPPSSHPPPSLQHPNPHPG